MTCQKHKRITVPSGPRELEWDTFSLWVSQGALSVTHEGNENTYAVNEFGHEFFSKRW